MHLTPEDIEKVRTKNIANLLRLSASGKPLTKSQQAELAEFAAGGRDRGTHSTAFAKDQGELAERLGVTRKTVGNCLRKFKKHPTHPVPKTRADGRYDVTAWAAFLIFHNIAHKAEDEPAPGTPDAGEDASNEPQTVTDWKAHKVKLECQKIEIEIRKTEGDLVEVHDVEKNASAVVSAFRTSLNNLPGRAAQKLIGLKDYHQIEAILQKECDICLRNLEACQYLPLADGASSGVRSTPPDTEDSHSTAGQPWDDVAGEKVTITRRPRKRPPRSLSQPHVRKKRGTSPKRRKS